MKDFTRDSVVLHMLTMAATIAMSMLTQMTCQLVDLYFVAQVGTAAVAGVNAAINGNIAITALTQVLSVGTVALIAQTVGNKDRTEANLVFNQSIALSFAFALLVMILLYGLTRPYLRLVAAEEATIEAGMVFMFWVLPGLALMIPMAVVGSALRGTGAVKPQIVIYMATMIINALLAPVLIAGWGTGIALGVKGAGLATTLSVLAGMVMLVAYFGYGERYLAIKLELLRPRLDQWRRIFTVGLPAGGEFALMFLSTAMVFYAIRDFGTSAQAGFGIGSRVLQALLLPGIAIAFAAGPIAGQNFGANNAARVKETFHKACLLVSVAMIAVTVFVHQGADWIVKLFEADAPSHAVAASFLQLMSWTLLAQSIIYVCANLFQGMGNTIPMLIGASTRFLVLVIAVWLSLRYEIGIESIWYLLIASVLLQAVVSLWLLRVEFARRLPSDSRQRTAPVYLRPQTDSMQQP